MPDHPPLKPGDTLVFVASDRRDEGPYNVTVERVGRRWAYLSNCERIDLGTMWAEVGAFGPAGRCYRSLAEYEEKVAVARAWQKFRTGYGISYLLPAGVTVADIREAARLLRLDINFEDRDA